MAGSWVDFMTNRGPGPTQGPSFTEVADRARQTQMEAIARMGQHMIITADRAGSLPQLPLSEIWRGNWRALRDDIVDRLPPPMGPLLNRKVNDFPERLGRALNLIPPAQPMGLNRLMLEGALNPGTMMNPWNLAQEIVATLQRRRNNLWD